MSIDKAFKQLHGRLEEISGDIFNRTVLFYGNSIKRTYNTFKPIVIDGKQITETKPSKIADSVVFETSKVGDCSHVGSISVNGNKAIVNDARRFEAFGKPGPFKLTILNFRSPASLEFELKRELTVSEELLTSIKNYPDVEIGPK